MFSKNKFDPQMKVVICRSINKLRQDLCALVFLLLMFANRLKLKSTAVPTVHLEPGTWSGILSPRKAQAPSMSYRERRGIVRELLAEP